MDTKFKRRGFWISIFCGAGIFIIIFWASWSFGSFSSSRSISSFSRTLFVEPMIELHVLARPSSFRRLSSWRSTLASRLIDGSRSFFVHSTPRFAVALASSSMPMHA